MKRIIINADDCGLSKEVNLHIEEAIQLGKISSTTIMANMDDFAGAVKLYNKYSKSISFGWHLNLDEGEALTKSQLLIDKLFFLEKEGRVYLNGKKFSRSILNKEMCHEIKKELRAQWEKIHDSGISITHVDSHHLYHTHPSMFFVLPSLFNELGITKCRRITNFNSKGFKGVARSVWATYFKLKGLQMPDFFCSYISFYHYPVLKDGDTIELMCHPGHPNIDYQKEYKLVLKGDVTDWGAKLITFNDL